MCVVCPPSRNVLGGETGAPGGNHQETAGFISFFLNREMLNFKNSATVSPKIGMCNGDKVFFGAKKHTVDIAQPGFEPGSLALKLSVLPLHQLLLQ